MVNKDTNSNAKILVKVDQNNLVYVDPNSVIKDGIVEPRNIDQEKLVMYVNLEADLVPRSYLLADTDNPRYVSIVSRMFNLLTPQNGTDLDTSWTDAYNPTPQKNKDTTLIFDKNDFHDSTGQAFGIESINIAIKGGNFIPQININFIDVRGKTLFEQPNDSPYNTFFHLPWPIFYLTIKGYYGKALKYRLHLTKFTSKYNESNGNFEISTTFVGSTFAYLNDIPLNGVINAPYLYASKTENPKTFNEQKGIYTQELKRSSKGYMMLKSVYAEMKQKNIIPEDFPVYTLRELEIQAQSLDKTLEKSIFDEVIDPKILGLMDDFNKTSTDLIKSVEAWISYYISPISGGKVNNEDIFFFLDKGDGTTSVKLDDENKSGTLAFILKEKGDALTKISEQINIAQMSKTNRRLKPNFTNKTLGKVTKYYDKAYNDARSEIEYGIIRDRILTDVYSIQNEFFNESSRIVKILEKEINVIIKDKNKGGLGFDPTIRNLFAILLANADVFVRMTKDVHSRAIDAGPLRKDNLQPFNKDETKGKDCIYPWPEVKKPIPGSRTQIIAYPGDLQLRSVLKSYDKNRWPEVEFVEQYIKFATKVTGVEKIDYFFDGNDEQKYLKSICTIFDSLNTIPFANRTLAPFLYEVYERSKQITLIDSFNSESLQELAEAEYQNLLKSLENEVDIVDVLKTIGKDGNPISKLLDLMEKFSPYDRYLYYQDSNPSTPYISETLSKPFNIEKYTNTSKSVNIDSYAKLKVNINNYRVEDYRKEIFPYSSDTYLSYISKPNYYLDNFSYTNVFSLESSDGFICGKVEPNMWVQSGNTENLFNQRLKVGNNLTHILNTPYFHNQLLTDFSNKTFARYVGSAYLLLNSLPFKDLDDNISNELRMASMFKEIGATHFVPYFLILKWGSIYHRYKNYIYTVDPEKKDILNGFLNTNGITQPISGSEFFDNNKGYSFIVPCETCPTTGITVSYNGQNTGFHPYYDTIYHQIINGYSLFNPDDVVISYNEMLKSGYTKCYLTVVNNLNQWTSIVDNSKYVITDEFYTLLPSYSFNRTTDNTTYLTTFNDDYQNAFRVVLEEEDFADTFSGKTFSGYNEYMRNINNQFSINSNNKKVIDLIATFSPDILDQFEEIFLSFASEELNEEVPQLMFPDLPYNSFQSVMKDLVRIRKFTYNDVNTLKRKISEEQQINFNKVTKNILTTSNLLKLTLGNPKEINSYVLEGFSGIATGSTFNYSGYLNSQLNQDNKDLIKLFIGEYPDLGTNHYEDFFRTQNVRLDEENIRNFRPIVLIYAGYVKKGENISFKDYLKYNIYDAIQGAPRRLDLFLNSLLRKLTGLTTSKNAEVNVEFYGGYNDEGLKIELYNFFKSFNDKWASGNSIGQKLLIEEFLFLDKANRDIGDRGYINLDRFMSLLDKKNSDNNLYGAISILLQGSGFDMRALPAYVNFYGKSLSSKTRITPSSTVAENLFGTFLDVDYEDSEPKMVIQYVEGPLSKHQDMENSQYNMYKDDSFDMSDNNNNPIIVTDPSAFTVDTMLKSNRAVAFEVSFGDQNQSIFKGVTLDQSTLKNTTESFGVLENLARSESGAGVYNIDTSLFEYYRQASYACEVSSMGNMMIQPTMYFYLKNIPMFKGSYWITEVNHKIANNTINTSFKGTRIPRAVLPDPIDSFVASFRPIMDKIVQKAINITKKETTSTTTTAVTIEQNGQTYTTDPGTKKIQGEELLKVAGITEFGLPYNGYNGEEYIQKVKYKNNEWFRAVVVRMGSDKNKISDDVTMNILCNLPEVTTDPDEVLWKELKPLSKDHDFYTSKFLLNSSDKPTLISKKKTIFMNPNLSDKTITLTPNYELLRNETHKLNVTGAVGVGPIDKGYGVAMSESLMRKLGLLEDDIVYFKFV